MLHCQNGRRDSLTIRARIVDPGEGLDAQGTVTVENGIVTAVETGPAAPACCSPAWCC